MSMSLVNFPLHLGVVLVLRARTILVVMQAFCQIPLDLPLTARIPIRSLSKEETEGEGGGINRRGPSIALNFQQVRR